MCFRRHDIRHQRFTHTCLLPYLLRSSPAAQNLHTVSKECCVNFPKRPQDSSLLAWYNFLRCWASLNEAWVKQWCKLIRHPLAANITSKVGAWTIQAPTCFVQPPTLNFQCLSCECPWPLALGNTVYKYVMYIIPDSKTQDTQLMFL